MPETSHLDELAFVFFKRFARMEYALKMAGRRKREDGKAEADWTKFAQEIDERFADARKASADLEVSVQYILNQPPKLQVVRAGTMGWEDTAPDAKCEADLVVLYVRRVRNNLHHGGKFAGVWLEPERSEPLLAHSLRVLEACLAASPEVEGAYYG